MPTITQIMSDYQIAQYLAVKDIARKRLFGGGIDVSLPEKIYNIGKSIQRVFDNDPTDTTLYKTAYFLYALCGIWGLKAEAVSGDSGAIAPVTTTSVLPIPLNFVVSASSTIPTGGSTATIASYQGYNLLFVRNGIAQSQINTGGSYYTWNRTTAEFECFGDAQVGEEFLLIPIG